MPPTTQQNKNKHNESTSNSQFRIRNYVDQSQKSRKRTKSMNLTKKDAKNSMNSIENQEIPEKAELGMGEMRSGEEFLWLLAGPRSKEIQFLI